MATNSYLYTKADGRQYYLDGTGTEREPTYYIIPEDGWIGRGAADLRLIADGTATQWTVAGGDLMLGDAKRIYFEASGTTKDTEFIYSASNGYMDYAAATAHRFDGNVVVNDTYSLTLSDTTAAGDGVILKGADRFIHNFHHPIGGGALPNGENTFIGVNAGNFTMGSGATFAFHASCNTVIGVNALSMNTIGWDNTAAGVNALRENTAGSNNTAAGMNALRVNTTGSYNTAAGMSALRVNTTGDYNTAAGMNALHENTTGDYNTAAGMDAGRYYGAGVDANATSFESVYLGALTRASADGRQNEIVIGYNAIGQGSNTAVLGHTTILNSYIRGNLTVGQGAAGVDYTVTFDGQDNDGVLTWMEDEDYFQFGDDLVMAAGESLDCATLGGYLKPRRLRQAAQPTPEVGELLMWSDSDDDSVHLVYRDADAGVVEVALA